MSRHLLSSLAERIRPRLKPNANGTQAKIALRLKSIQDGDGANPIVALQRTGDLKIQSMKISSVSVYNAMLRFNEPF